MCVTEQSYLFPSEYIFKLIAYLIAPVLGMCFFTSQCWVNEYTRSCLYRHHNVFMSLSVLLLLCEIKLSDVLSSLYNYIPSIPDNHLLIILRKQVLRL